MRGHMDSTLDAIKDESRATVSAGAGATDKALPVIVIRFPPTYAWLAMGIGGVFFVLGLLIALVFPHGKVGVGAVLCALSLVGVIGANYWRLHLHVVARLTPRQLILRRGGAVDWSDIAEIERKEIRSSYRGVSNRSEFVCIRLTSRPAATGRLDGILKKVKHGVTGYDIIVPGSELSCGAAWFVAECHKRMAAARAGA